MDQKKVAQLPPLRTTLLAPDPEDPTSTTLELDELWSFVLKKGHDSWIWIALCRKTRQVVAYAVGDRSRQDVSMLVGGHSRQLSYWSLLHGFLGNISGGHPMPEQHTAVGKETGETAHVERWNNTLRQRLARFVRMT